MVDNNSFGKPLKGKEKKNFIAEVEFAMEAMAYYWSLYAFKSGSPRGYIKSAYVDVVRKYSSEGDFKKIMGQKRDKYGRFLYKIDCDFYCVLEMDRLFYADSDSEGDFGDIKVMLKNPDKYFKMNTLFGK